MKNIYVDGQHGTTGLEIKRFIGKHPSLTLIEIPYEKRHDVDLRKTLMNAADAVVLCLPDQASVEALSLLESPKTIVIDTSTAHRTHPDWVYGLPEIGESQKSAIKGAKRIANPGCHASAVLLGMLPLMKTGLLKLEQSFSFISHTGYTGGGKEMISMYKNTKKIPSIELYSLGQSHKHIPEIMKYGQLNLQPTFIPIVCNYPRGILMSFPVSGEQLTRVLSLEEVYEVYQAFYKASPFATINLPNTCNGKLGGESTADNDFEVFITGTASNFVISVRLDNLGKGASGAVIQTLNLLFEYPERLGL